MNRTFATAVVSAFGLVLIPHSICAQSFVPGNLAILRLGDGVQALVNSGNTVFLDQYTTNGALVNSLTLPDNGPEALLLSGTAGSEGGLARSLDRTVVVLTGYNTNRGSVAGALANTLGTAVPRAVATIDAAGAFHLVQTSTVAYSGNNIRGAIGDGTNGFWTAGTPGGTWYFNPPEAPVNIQTNGGNTRAVNISGGNLYFSTQAGFSGIYGFQGGGLPRTGDTTNLLFGTGANSQPAGFAVNSTLTVAYVADQRSTAGGIQKWVNNAGLWSMPYAFLTGAGAFAVAVDWSGPAPVIYAVTGENSANRLVSVVDTNSSATVNLLANAGANRLFRGLDFVPEQPPTYFSLAIARAGTNIALSWPVAVSGYGLQSNSNLVQANDWTAVNAPVVATGGYHQVTLPLGGGVQFYRLKAQ